MKSKKFLIFFFLAIFLFQFFQTIYFNRNLLMEKYDSSYWKDRFEHSQWVLPLSARIIGDDGLFSYVGYRLVKGDDPSKNNPETEPVGKYLIGLSIVYFNNPVFYSLIFGFLSLGFFYLLAIRILKEKTTAIFVALLLFIDPLFFTQFWKPWVDIVQLFFLLSNVLCLFLISKKSKYNQIFALLSGLSLGLFAETKFPILLPVIVILEFVLFLKNRILKEYAIYILGFVVGIFLPYFQYFILGHSILDFFKLQKYIVVFYKKSQLVLHLGSIFPTLLLGKFPLINQPGFSLVSEWWFMWPITFLISIFVILRLFIKRKNEVFLKGLGLFLILTLLIFALIPSYPRYLVLILPFCYLFFGYFIDKYLKEKYKIIIFVFVLLYGVVNAWFFLLPKPQGVLDDFYYNFSHQYFQDIFKEDILAPKGMDINKFRDISQKTMFDATIKDITIKQEQLSFNSLSDTGFVKVKIIYKTQDLGYFSEDKEIGLSKENGEWKIKWTFSILLDKFEVQDGVKVSLDIGKRGSILANDGKVLAEDGLGYLISVSPSKIDTKREQKMLNSISSLTGIIPVRLQNAYLENPMLNSYIPIATLYKDISDSQKQQLLSYPGLKIRQYPTRKYNYGIIDQSAISNTLYKDCCTNIYSAYSYHGIAGEEKKFDSDLWGYSGGVIQILSKDGKLIRKILDKNSKNGHNVNVAL